MKASLLEMINMLQAYMLYSEVNYYVLVAFRCINFTHLSHSLFHCIPAYSYTSRRCYRSHTRLRSGKEHSRTRRNLHKMVIKTDTDRLMEVRIWMSAMTFI